MARRVIGVLLCLVGLAACSSSAGDRAAGTFPEAGTVQAGPSGADFYAAPPAPADAEPGDLIWASRLPAPENVVGYAILYWSTRVDGTLVAVSGVVFGPVAPPGGRPSGILAWAHGTLGLGDQCAPSTGYFEGNGVSVPLVRAAADEGLVFVASDYEGLGTPGEHPFIVNRPAAADVLDSIRAASALMGTAAPSLIMGQSQGGAAALVAAEMQPRYAPEIALTGVVALSAPSALDRLDETLRGGPYDGYLIMTVYGYSAAYPQVDTSGLTESGRAALDRIGTQCSDEILDGAVEHPARELGADQVLNSPAFVELLRTNDAGGVRPGVPVLLVHGEDDDTVPVANSRALRDRYCALGARVEGRYYPEAGHIDVLSAALPDIVTYVRNRLAGTATNGTCP